MKYDLLILEYAIRRGLDPALIKAIVKWESNFKPYLKTPESRGRFSYGLMQILDQTARTVFGIYDPRILFDPRTNIHYGTKYMASLKKRYPDNIKDQIASYNAGSPKFDLWGRYINQNYVDKVYSYYKTYKGKIIAGFTLALAMIGGILLIDRK